jgi:hypothetical protein
LIRLLSWLLLLFALTLTTLAVLLFLATASAPQIERPARLSLADLDRGRLIVQSLDLKHLKEGEERRLRFGQEDLELALNWMLGSLGRGGADVVIDSQSLKVSASMRLYKLPRYLNLTLAFRPQGDLLVPSKLRLGKVPLPAHLTGKVLGALLAISPAAEQYRVARDMLHKATLQPGHVELTLVWRGAALQRAMRNAGWNPAGLTAADLAPYHARLAATQGHDFATLLGAVFALAQERSRTRDPVAENRNAIAALAEVAIGGRLFVTQGERKPLRKLGAHLAQREDSAQHFSLSAFIAVTGGEDIADLAGLYKETRDARHGSGFSFNDLAADRAGSRFGELATRTPETARQVQKRLSGSHDEHQFYPEAKDFPENMNQSQFEQRFGGVGAPAYIAEVREIEARIAALPLYREE